jgi:hypothetical protein
MVARTTILLAAVLSGLVVAGPLAVGATSTKVAAKASSAESQRGPRGPRGPRGRRGPRGYRGLRGATGPQGVQGAAGSTGEQGPRGIPGPAGRGITRPGFARTVLAVAPAGMRPSVAIGADGLPLLTDDPWHGLEVAHCDDLACTSATRTTLDSGSETFSSVAIGADGLGLIAYDGPQVKVAHCSNIVCSSATISTLGGEQDSAFAELSVAIGSDGLGLIAFTDPKGLFPKVAHCENVECSQATITRLDQTSIAGEGTSVTIGADGLGLISYQDIAGGSLNVAHCSTLDCSTVTTSVVDTDPHNGVGQWNSITTGDDGLALLSYNDQPDGSLRVAHCSDLTCSSATTTTIDTVGVGGYTSIAIGADGLGVVANEKIASASEAVKVAHCSNVVCSTATVATLEAAPNVFGTALTIGVDGLPLVGYWKQNSGLVAVHCSNVFCLPYFQRR